MSPTMNGVHSPSKPRIAYLGPEASFSHQAAQEAFPDGIWVSLPSFSAILSAIQDSSPTDSATTAAGTDSSSPAVDYAVLPVENSTNGAVVQALDLLAQCGLDPSDSPYADVRVVAEHYLQVHHCLFVAESSLDHLPQKLRDRCLRDRHGGLRDHDDDAEENPHDVIRALGVRTVYSHPQVWGQCHRFLSAVLPPPLVERVDVSSTSAAASTVAKNKPTTSTGSSTAITAAGVVEFRPVPPAAAISSMLAGRKHDLVCLARDIEDHPGRNTTRFLVLRNRNLLSAPPPAPSSSSLDPDRPRRKSLLAFTIPHAQPGSLASALAVFARHGFNLTAIQSRPGRGRSWCYVFFVECERVSAPVEDGEDGGPQEGNGVERLVGELEGVTEMICWLGSWEDRLMDG